ncbi:hypothetical protein A5678_15220 [Mycobacterium sp. E2733]|nr:hypothetical protein A5678_15220 [Mycobacterium sp. E2733]
MADAGDAALFELFVADHAIFFVVVLVMAVSHKRIVTAQADRHKRCISWHEVSCKGELIR